MGLAGGVRPLAVVGLAGAVVWWKCVQMGWFPCVEAVGVGSEVGPGLGPGREAGD